MINLLVRLFYGIVWSILFSLLAFMIAAPLLAIFLFFPAVMWLEWSPDTAMLWTERLCGLSIIVGGLVGFFRGVK